MESKNSDDNCYALEIITKFLTRLDPSPEVEWFLNADQTGNNLLRSVFNVLEKPQQDCHSTKTKQALILPHTSKKLGCFARLHCMGASTTNFQDSANSLSKALQSHRFKDEDELVHWLLKTDCPIKHRLSTQNQSLWSRFEGWLWLINSLETQGKGCPANKNLSPAEFGLISHAVQTIAKIEQKGHKISWSPTLINCFINHARFLLKRFQSTPTKLQEGEVGTFWISVQSWVIGYMENLQLATACPLDIHCCENFIKMVELLTVMLMTSSAGKTNCEPAIGEYFGKAIHTRVSDLSKELSSYCPSPNEETAPANDGESADWYSYLISMCSHISDDIEIIEAKYQKGINSCDLHINLMSIASPEYETLFNFILATLERRPIKIETSLFKLQSMLIKLHEKLSPSAPSVEPFHQSPCFKAIEEESDRWGRQLKARLLIWSQRLRESEEWTESFGPSKTSCSMIEFALGIQSYMNFHNDAVRYSGKFASMLERIICKVFLVHVKALELEAVRKISKSPANIITNHRRTIYSLPIKTALILNDLRSMRTNVSDLLQASIKATKGSSSATLSSDAVRPGERLNMTLLDLEKAYSEIVEEVVSNLMSNSNGLTSLLACSTHSSNPMNWNQLDIDSKLKANLVPFWHDLRECEKVLDERVFRRICRECWSVQADQLVKLISSSQDKENNSVDWIAARIRGVALTAETLNTHYSQLISRQQELPTNVRKLNEILKILTLPRNDDGMNESIGISLT